MARAPARNMGHAGAARLPRVPGEEEARTQNPRLYYQIKHGPVSFEHIAKAWWMTKKPGKKVSKDKERASVFLENLAREKFAADHKGIQKDFWQTRPWGCCALTGDGWIHSLLNTSEPELVLYQERIHQLCRDAHRTFEPTARRQLKIWKQAKNTRQTKNTAEAAGPAKAEKDLMEVGEMLYSLLTQVIYAASVLEHKKATSQEKEDASAAVRNEWKTVQAAVDEMIQRQARFEYFQGVLAGGLIAIPLLLFVGWAAAHFGANQFSEPGRPGSFTAAIIGGALGAVTSVAQRMTTRTRAPLVIDFTAPKLQKFALGALRPLVGAVFGAAIYFAIIGGLLAVDAKTGRDASVALAFFAVVGFVAGFSERFATDILNRAGSGIAPGAHAEEDAQAQPGRR